jgi:hypothetical protein
MTKVSEKVLDNFVLCNIFSENRAVCKIEEKNTVQLDRPQVAVLIILRMRFACWVN